MNFIEPHVDEIYEGIKNISKIYELDQESSREFIVSSKEEVISKLIEDKEVVVVVGSFFGDESKGKTVAAITNNADIKLIARVNSGENAGHTVYLHGKKYIFHLAPSGLLTEKINVIGPNCVMDPISFMNNEIQPLIKDNMDYSNLIIGNVHIVTPYHKIIDALGTKNSSTLKGMSPIHSSKVTKKGLRLGDLFNSENNQRAIIKKDMKIYDALLNMQEGGEQLILEMCNRMNEKLPGRIPLHVIDFLKAENKIEYLIELYRKNIKENPLFPKRGDVLNIIRKTLNKEEKVLLEGPQSYFLSNNVETFWGSSTSADTTSAGIKASAGYNQEKYKSVTINVHKVPTSRVGIGGNPSGFVKQDFFSKRDLESLEDLGTACDNFDAIQKQFHNSIQENGILKPTIYKDDQGEYTIGAAMAISSSREHEEFGATTKKPRVCGTFDCVAHHSVNDVQGPYLTVSAIDRLNSSDEVGLVIGYTFFNPENKTIDSKGVKYKNGDIIKIGDPMPNEPVLKHCYPIIKKMPGWKETPIIPGNLNFGDSLPKSLNRFLANIEMYTGAEIISFGNGTKTDNLVYLKRK